MVPFLRSEVGKNVLFCPRGKWPDFRWAHPSRYLLLRPCFLGARNRSREAGVCAREGRWAAVWHRRTRPGSPHGVLPSGAGTQLAVPAQHRGWQQWCTHICWHSGFLHFPPLLSPIKITDKMKRQTAARDTFPKTCSKDAGCHLSIQKWNKGKIKLLLAILNLLFLWKTHNDTVNHMILYCFWFCFVSPPFKVSDSFSERSVTCPAVSEAVPPACHPHRCTQWLRNGAPAPAYGELCSKPARLCAAMADLHGKPGRNRLKLEARSGFVCAPPPAFFRSACPLCASNREPAVLGHRLAVLMGGCWSAFGVLGPGITKLESITGQPSFILLGLDWGKKF